MTTCASNLLSIKYLENLPFIEMKEIRNRHSKLLGDCNRNLTIVVVKVCIDGFEEFKRLNSSSRNFRSFS